MKKVIHALMLLISAAAIISCSNDPAHTEGSAGLLSPPPDSLRFISDVDSIEKQETPAVRSMEDRTGDPIIGVMLRYAIAPGYDAYTFYLQYLGDGETAFNGDGVEYNYILYVPGIILDTYSEASGEYNHGQGTAFWVYMDTYMGMSRLEVKENWHEALSILLENPDNLPVPDAKDYYSHPWVADKAGYPLPDDFDAASIEEGKLYIISMQQKDRYPAPTYENSSMYNSNFRFRGVSDNSAITENCFYVSSDSSLYYPDALIKTYNEYKEEESDNGNPLWKYLVTYFGISLAEVKGQGLQIAIDALTEAETLPYPSAEDYRQNAASSF